MRNEDKCGRPNMALHLNRLKTKIWSKGTHCVEEKWYRYQSKWYRYPLTEEDWYWYNQSGPTTDASSNLGFVPLALVSLVFVHRLFRDPNKG